MSAYEYNNLYDTKNFYGRKKIEINVDYEEFVENPIEVLNEYLGTILSEHRFNVAQMEYLKTFHKGKHNILEKQRANGDLTINNKSIQNYAWQFVNFKKGYYVGKPIKYVDKNIESNKEDMKYFNAYLNDVAKASEDLIKYENMLIMGIAHTLVVPTKVKPQNEYKSPFIYKVLDNKNVCVVHSSGILKEKLFSLYISKVKEKETKREKEIYTIYYDNVCLKVQKIENFNEYEIISKSVMPISNCITEYCLNEQRMGVFEIVINKIDNLNNITSNQMDLIEEYVNSYMTFENVDISEVIDNIDSFREKRILAVNTNNPTTPAKIGSISCQLDFTSTNQLYEREEQRMYDIVGVPMSTSNTGQGVSGEAQTYGGGWESAQNNASVDTQYIMRSEREDLEKMLTICKNEINSKITSLYPTNIDIKYTINKSNNIMVKAQSLKYLIDGGFTREQALTYTEITDDPQTDGKVADENYINNKKIDIDLELYKEEIMSSLNQEETEDEENNSVEEIEENNDIQ